MKSGQQSTFFVQKVLLAIWSGKSDEK